MERWTECARESEYLRNLRPVPSQHVLVSLFTFHVQRVRRTRTVTGGLFLRRPLLREMSSTDSARFEIDELYFPVFENHHIARLQIAVNNSVEVEVHQARHDLRKKHPGDTERERSTVVDH